MANDIHSQITSSSEIHVPKGFTEASNSTVLSKAANGTLEWVSKDDVGGSQGPQGETGPVSSITNVKTVQLDPQPGQYSLLSAAIASITDASESNPYYINLGPGTFTEISTIVMKPWVYVRGTGKTSRVIFNFNDNHGVLGSDYSAFENCFVSYSDMTAEGFALFYLENLTSGAQNRNFVIKNIHVGWAFTGIHCKASTYFSQINCFDISYGGSYSCHYLFRVETTGSQRARIIAEALRPVQVATPRPFALIYATGTNAEFVGENFLANSGGNALSGHTYGVVLPEDGTPTPATLGKYGVYAENGATVRIISGTLRGWETGIYSANVGSGPFIYVNGMYLDRNTTSINIAHPDTSGAIFAQAEGSKITVDSAVNDLTLLVSDIETGSQGIINIGKMRIAPSGNYAGLFDAAYLTKFGSVSGCYEGGMISVNSGLTVNITAGKGYFYDTGSGLLKEVEWTAKTAQAITANSDTYLIVNAAGNVVETASITATENVILLGRVVTAASTIRFIENLPAQGAHAANKIYDFHRKTFGCVYESGSTVAENGSVAYNLDIGQGVRWFMGNDVTTNGANQATFTQIYRNGSGGWTETTLQTVNSTQYDNGTGTLQALTAAYFSARYLYVVGSDYDSTEKYYLQMGQGEYATLTACQDEAIPTPPTWLKDGAVVIAQIVVKQGGASITAVGSITSLKPTLGGAAVSGGGGGSSDHGSLLGLSDDDHTQYLLASGSRAMSGSLDMGTNNITNVGLVDGVDVSAHASRHLPNGADPISTAIATTITGDGANAEGTANTLARSDHKHEILLAYKGATAMDLQDLQNANHSCGVISGLEITANGGTPTNIDIASGDLLIREDSTRDGKIWYYSYAGTTNQALTINSNNYVYIQWNAGSPALQILTTKSTDHQTKCYLGKIYYDGVAGALHIANYDKTVVSDHASAMANRLAEAFPYAKTAGGVLTEVGTRNFALSASTWWHKLSTWTLGALNTQTTDTFAYFYNRSSWTYTSGNSQISNTQYDNAGVLTAMTAGYYRVDDIYVEPEDGHLAVIYGNAEYATISEAKGQSLLVNGSLPNQIMDHGKLLGRVIIQQGASAFTLLLNNGIDTLVTQVVDPDLSYSVTSAVTDDTVASVTYVQVASMTVTPAAGVWDISFSASGNVDTNGADGNYAIYVGGTIVTHTERNVNFNAGAAASGFDNGMHSQHIAILNGATAVAVYAKVSAGNFVIHERSLKLVKIGNA